MQLPIRQKNKARKLPKAVQDYMRRRFLLLPDYLSSLRCFEDESYVEGRPVRHLRIFNPQLARYQNISIRAGRDLDQQPEVLVYEGYMDDQGGIYMEDLRTMSYPQDISRQRT